MLLLASSSPDNVYIGLKAKTISFFSFHFQNLFLSHLSPAVAQGEPGSAACLGQAPGFGGFCGEAAAAVSSAASARRVSVCSDAKHLLMQNIHGCSGPGQEGAEQAPSAVAGTAFRGAGENNPTGFTVLTCHRHQWRFPQAQFLDDFFIPSWILAQEE